MISTSMRLKMMIVVVMTAILVSCTAKPAAVAPTATPGPTIDQQPTFNAIETQAAKTVVANLTLNAPTATPITPTHTTTLTATVTQTNPPPLPTARPTATYVPWTLTPTYTPTPIGYGCSVDNVSPKSTDIFQPNADFDGKWIVTNIGTQSWLLGQVDIDYISGTKFQTKGDAFDIQSNVKKGGSYTVIIDMKAPSTAGTYQAAWAIMQGSLTICPLSLTVVVK